MKMQKNKIAQNLMVLRHCINCPRKRWPGGSAFPGRLSQSGRAVFPYLKLPPARASCFHRHQAETAPIENNLSQKECAKIDPPGKSEQLPWRVFSHGCIRFCSEPMLRFRFVAGPDLL